MIHIKSTKRWDKLATAHCQFFDREADGSYGVCASVHGYDRSVTATFAGIPDDYGWCVGFGELRLVKHFLEYYFDHSTVVPANDPRLHLFHECNERMLQEGHPPLARLRVLPYGVSMEMSALFIWEQVNPYIYDVTDGRCWVERIECREHEANAAFIEVGEIDAIRQGHRMRKQSYLVQQPSWEYQSPHEAINRLRASIL